VKLSEAVRADYEDKWHAEANKVAAMVDAAGERLRRYAELADQIIDVIREAEAVNREAGRINGSAPDGVHRRVDKVELAHLKNLVLPDPQHPDRDLWPPRSSL